MRQTTKKTTIEEEFDEFIRDACSVYPRPKSEMRSRLKSLLKTQLSSVLEELIDEYDKQYKQHCKTHGVKYKRTPQTLFHDAIIDIRKRNKI